jgi:hypothetical protein
VPAAQFVRFRLILNELVSPRAYAPLRQELTRNDREAGSGEHQRGERNATDAQSATDVAARGWPVNVHSAIMVIPGLIYGQVVNERVEAHG